jgi:flagellar hook-associated protein 2
VQQSLREVINTASTDNGGAFSNLSDIGISRDDSGKLKINQEILNDKLKTSLSDVQSLFAGKTESKSGLATSLLSISDGLSGDVKTAITGFDASVERMNKNITAQQGRLDTLRALLNKQFSTADAAIGQLNGQGTTLTSILKAMEPTSR